MIARVLVVDDDAAIRRALSGALTRAGFSVTTMDDGAPAIAVADSEQFDLVVVDYNMGVATGADVVRSFKDHHGASIYCAVLSGNDDDETRSACLAAGADDVFVKPASALELRTRLTAAAHSLRRTA